MKVSEFTHALRIPFTITTPAGILERFVYVSLICGQEICLIDTGVLSSHELIFEYIRQTGRRPEEISTLVLTHSHPDHIGSAKIIKESTGCEIVAHSAEKQWIESIDKQYAARPVPGFYSLVNSSVEVDKTVQEGEIISLGDDLKLKVIHTPGHSPGSISLYVEPDKVLISGDVIPVPGEMPIYDDPLILIESIRKLKALPEIEVLLSSWAEAKASPAAAAAMDDGIAYLDSLHRTVREAYRTNKSMEAAELAHIVLRTLNLPQYMANPLVARSLAGSLRYL